MGTISLEKNLGVPRSPLNINTDSFLEEHYKIVLNNKQIGCVSICSTFDNARIFDVSISFVPDYQKAEFNIEVLRALDSVLSKSDISAFILVSRDNSLETIKTYQNFGASPCFERRGSLLSLDGKCIRWLFGKFLLKKPADKNL